ncbi:DUF4352 domain-containing protein [Lactiplantibacillus sp. WILCCON 0030]|uniref:DUF4352 domain-containing protein n=1 Tax=Lactiplantibacillus brownii TaxID=3069269 RepID=A0ABU1ABS1_9LACO|nr:DUF4352 domain-containing protein [Lactiplantibacillus brownii]MDQ7938409.1 DUF4352 domain-containing protein [Lactiplantibacillus brownii]
MAKKRIDANGKTFIAVKPWYQKWWLWLLIVFGIILAIGVLSPTRSNTKQTDKVAKPARTTTQILKVGETAKLDHMQLTVNSVKTASSFDDDLSKPKSGNQYYTVNLTLENIGKSKVSYNPYDFKIKSAGNRTDLDEINTNDRDTLDSGELSANGKVTGDLIGQAKQSGTVTLIYTPNALSNQHLTVKLQ